MSRLIDEERLCQDLDKLYKQAEERRLKDLQKLLLDYITPITVGQPTIKEKQGKWIRDDNGTYSCSVCQSWIPEEQHCYARYCLYCGARMEEE